MSTVALSSAGYLKEPHSTLYYYNYYDQMLIFGSPSGFGCTLEMAFSKEQYLTR